MLLVSQLLMIVLIGLIRMKVNWNSYIKDFPERYVKKGYFDLWLEKQLNNIGPMNILDVGGGTTGTAALNRKQFNVWLLDPNISEKSDWMQGKIDWYDLNDKQFDLDVARGSINYLTKDRIRLLSKHTKRIIANSFSNPPPIRWTSRQYTSKSTDGIETVRFLPRSRRIEHMLRPFWGETVTHFFNYYSMDEFLEMLPGVNITKHSKNSIILDWEYKEQTGLDSKIVKIDNKKYRLVEVE